MFINVARRFRLKKLEILTGYHALEVSVTHYRLQHHALLRIPKTTMLL
jgi:hypothetical protein